MKKSKQKKHSKVDTLLLNAALQFMENASPQFSRKLRNLLLDYISQNKDCLPVDFDIYLLDFNNLFALLDTINDYRIK